MLTKHNVWKISDMKIIHNKQSDPLNSHTIVGCELAREESDIEYGLYNEEFFKKLLSIERKRTERSKRPFLLLLIDIEKILPDLNSTEVFYDLLPVLFKTTRETDLRGWYRRNAEIGIICTEIDAVESRRSAETIAMKIRTNLLKQLPSGLAKAMGICIHLFPESPGTPVTIDLVDPTFYPEAVEQDVAVKINGFLKRIMDIIGSLCGLLIFSPVFLFVPLLIKLTSEGPVFFRQERIGRFGTKFVFLKFRSMYIDNDDTIHRSYIRELIAGNIQDCNDGSTAVYKIKDDPRVTPAGRFLRKTSLDEIPQFLNVLKGDMSLVGPRPAIPYEFENYDIWHRHRLLQVKPGITGLWQVKGRSSTTFDDMVRLDLKYIREWSLWLDVKLLFLTPFAVFKGKGAC
jgi:lipopolysaccharide/colanic/teichoic acid biosynthesis glycosyltransferase